MSNYLLPLPWDSTHFGYPVYRITQAGLSDQQLVDCLDCARAVGAALVYWFTEANRNLADETLSSYGGRLVDCRFDFCLTLAEAALQDWVLPSLPASDLEIAVVPSGPATEELRSLAVSAGEFSRFRRDPNVLRSSFEDLYHQWIDRSTRREIADTVLVAKQSGRIAGMVTISREGQQARIGLISVSPDFQKNGIGTQLLRYAHGWMVDRQVSESLVATQKANVAACRLYRRAGYRLVNQESVYHFWL